MKPSPGNSSYEIFTTEDSGGNYSGKENKVATDWNMNVCLSQILFSSVSQTMAYVLLKVNVLLYYFTITV